MANKNANELAVYTPAEIQFTLTKAGLILKYLGNGIDRVNYFVDTVQDVVNAGYLALCRAYDPEGLLEKIANSAGKKSVVLEKTATEIEMLILLLVKAGYYLRTVNVAEVNGEPGYHYVFSEKNDLDKYRIIVSVNEDGNIWHN